MKLWPSHNNPLNFEEIFNPAYELLSTYVKKKKLKYDGYETPPHLADVDGTPAKERFETDYLEYHKERGRDTLWVILHFVFHLGVAQGVRIAQEKPR